MAALPTNPVGLYWAYWNPVSRLVDFPVAYSVIFLFHATPVGGAPGTTGAVTLNKPTGTPGTFYNADIVTCRARGQKVIMTVGGAGAQVNINTQARADAFIQSVKDINTSLKVGTALEGGAATVPAIDGIDWNNFEASEVAGSPQWMTYASQELKTFYGSDFLITAPPAVHGASPGGQAESDRLLLATLHNGNALDWFCPQFYDGGGNNTVSTVRTLLDYYNTSVTISGSPVQIPRSKIGIGFAIDPTNSTWWTTANAASCYSTMVSEGRTPRGAFNFAAHVDPSNTFATDVAPTIEPNPLGGGALVPNAVDAIAITESVTASASAPQTFASLSDNFNDNVFTSSKWVNNGGAQIVETGGRLQFTTTTSPSFIPVTSQGIYNLTGASVSNELVSAGNQALASYTATPVMLQSPETTNSRLYWEVKGDAIRAVKRVSGTVTVAFSATYSAATHRWFRIREASGTTFWDTSVDGDNWTNRYSESNPITVTRLVAIMRVHTDGAEGSTTTMLVDNFNTTGAFLLSSQGEDITITESISLSITRLQSIFDTISLTESTTSGKSFTISVFDAISITENIAVVKILTLSASEALSITENTSRDAAGGLLSGTATDVLTITENITITLAAQSFASLSDNFNDFSFNTALWERTDTNRVNEIALGYLEITTSQSPSYISCLTVGSYDLTGTHVLMELRSAGSQTLATYAAYPMILYIPGTTIEQELRWQIDGGTIYAMSGQTAIFSAAYTNATYRWLRIRESGGTIFWDSATDGANWTNRASLSNPFAVTYLKFCFMVGTEGSNPSTVTTMAVDNFNNDGVLYISSGDDITIIESVSVRLIVPVSLFETIAITENLAIAGEFTRTASVFDAVSITENTGTATSYQSVGSFNDNFNDNNINTTYWINWGGVEVFESNQQLNILAPSFTTEYQGMEARGYYFLEGSGTFIELVSAGDQSLASFEAYPITLQTSATEQVFWLVTLNRIHAYKKVGGISIRIFDTAYNTTDHRWFRIRESGGTTFWDTSSDAVSWITHVSAPNPISLTAMTIVLQAGTWQSEATDSTMILDNFNVVENIISPVEAISITESAEAAVTRFLSTSDSVSITEAVTRHSFFDQSATEAVAISENITVLAQGLPTASDAIVISEDVSFAKSITVSVSDAVSIAENNSFSAPFAITSVSDDISITENVISQIQATENVFESVSITENITPTSFFATSVSDSISITENVSNDTIQFSPSLPKHKPRGRMR